MKTLDQKDIIIFDGECNLCNGVVGWLLKFAPKDIFSFVPFQSPRGQELLKTHGFPTESLDTVILIDEAGIKTHSDGFLRIVSKIPKWQRVAALLAFIPRMIRDYIYVTASRNRVKWFGSSNSCTINLSPKAS
ncbi:DCC1-like thiol-disulfide oxidoreductase family protein [Winogradskyella sp. 3972H.M.0a.05]|uniref:thiol-disulfide oxidoreductase DCC family protein n=1 Tax=Winogradskyella sp. 3972H.M.0a.05 TaxID=2950277 RepID=UPI0033967514